MNNMICTCYIDANDTHDKNLVQKLRKIDFNKITHIAIAFAQLKEIDGFWVACVKDSVASGIEKIKAQISSGGFDVKLLLSVGGAGADGFCQAARTAQGRKRFAESVISILDRYKLDGVDIDWEYPGESSLGITRCKHCKSDFILLLEELRSHLKNRLLTIAVGSNRYFGMNVKKIGEITDYVFVMTYDLGIMHSNAYLSKAFVTMWHILGIPARKLCMGVPLYGRSIKNLTRSESFCKLKLQRHRHIFGQSFTYHNSTWWCFDTENDVRKKAQWVKKKKLGGIFCWEIGSDDNNRILNSMVCHTDDETAA